MQEDRKLMLVDRKKMTNTWDQSSVGHDKRGICDSDIEQDAPAMLIINKFKRFGF